MSNIQSLLESAGAGWKNLQSDAVKLAAKWEKTGLLEGLKSEVERNNMSLILENQAKQLVVETSQVDGGTAAFTPGTGNNWAGIALPLVRKVFGQIAAKEFVSVQPMNLPSGLVFYLDFQYGNTKNSATNTSPNRYTAWSISLR
jgi:predicted alternative tryptophan synthase beta-subunit